MKSSFSLCLSSSNIKVCYDTCMCAKYGNLSQHCVYLASVLLHLSSLRVCALLFSFRTLLQSKWTWGHLFSWTERFNSPPHKCTATRMPAFSRPTGWDWTCLYWDGFKTVIENVFRDIKPAFLFLTGVFWYIALFDLNLLRCFKNTVQHAEDLEKIFSGFTNCPENFPPHKHPCQRVCTENKATGVTFMLLVTNVSSAVSLKNNSSILSRPALTLDLAALSRPPGPLWYHEAAQQNQETNLFLSQEREWKLSKLATQLLFQRAQSWRLGRMQMRAPATSALLQVCRKGRGNAVCRKCISLVSCSWWPACTEFRILFVPFLSWRYTSENVTAQRSSDSHWSTAHTAYFTLLVALLVRIISRSGGAMKDHLLLKHALLIVDEMKQRICCPERTFHSTWLLSAQWKNR